jgi:hypothetical protein
MIATLDVAAGLEWDLHGCLGRRVVEMAHMGRIAASKLERIGRDVDDLAGSVGSTG